MMANGNELQKSKHMALQQTASEVPPIGSVSAPLERKISEFEKKNSDTNVMSDVHGILVQQPSNISGTPPHQISQTASHANEHFNVAQNIVLAIDIERSNSDQSESKQKVQLHTKLEKSLEYIDSDTGSSHKVDSSQTNCDTNLEHSKSKTFSEVNRVNSGEDIDLHVRNSVLEVNRSIAATENISHSASCASQLEPLDSLDIGASSQKDMKESFGVSGNTSRNQGFRPAELTNQLISGPCIVLPSSQLPTNVSSNEKSGPSQPSSPGSDTPGQLISSGSGQPFPQHGSLCSYETVQVENKVPGHAALHQTTENVSKTASDSEDKENSATRAVDVAPHSTSEPPASPLPAASTSSGAVPKTKRTPNDFIFGKVIGEGSYSTVYLTREVSSQKEFAIKVCDKKHLIRERKTHFVMREKEVLMRLDHPFFIKLAYTFQDSERLYYVLTYARNGELLGYLHKLSAFDVPCTRFYSAEIVLALEHLQSLGIVHRDLKPENILLSEDMHIKITDFGTSKILSLDSKEGENQAKVKRKNSFVGTAEYVSPEVLNNQPANFGSDLWALGCIIYQCLSGSLPFRSGNEYQTFQKIVKGEYDFPEGFHPLAKDLVQKLLVLEPSARLGMTPPEGMKDLKNHQFYDEINWDQLPETTPPTLMPYLPATAHNPEFWGQEQRVGFDDQRLAEIITGQSADGSVLVPELFH